MKRKTRSCSVVDSAAQCIRCKFCGEEAPFPLGAVTWVVGYTKAFDEAHSVCRPGDGQLGLTRLTEIVPVELRADKAGGAR